MNRRRNLIISIIAACLACGLVYGVYVLQLKQVEWQKTVRVVVPKDYIPAGTVLTADMLEYYPLLAGSFSEGMETSLERMVGSESLVPLGSQEPVLAWKVDRFNLLPRRNQSTFQIPKEYILTVSNGIRAGDRVRLYASALDGPSVRLFEEEITVASVKSAANQEVDNPKNSNLISKANGDAEKMYISRREANGAIDQINLNLTEEQWLTIDTLCKSKKAKLVIAFTSVSITEQTQGKAGS
ncbi:flagellar biosynthesis protein FlgA [Paenibacillus sp. y28]|uniref:flagellar biosynthesis protein FlgA n=1 Tax=Paenibacillus sp. y28 TaxID=3129110 RepID=UPI0030171BA5